MPIALFNQRKVNTLFAVGLVALVLAGAFILRESLADEHQKVVVGILVRVKFGFYQDCKGVVIREVYSDPVTDRSGVFHPSIFAGYAVDLTCNNEHTGDRFFTTDFLRVVRK